MYVVTCKIDHCIHIHWCIVMGLGHNDPWVESHMWPQQTWGQRSCRGQWPLVQVFGKKDQCIHILWCIFKSNITMIAKVCACESRRDSWFENRLVFEKGPVVVAGELLWNWKWQLMHAGNYLITDSEKLALIYIWWFSLSKSKAVWFLECFGLGLQNLFRMYQNQVSFLVNFWFENFISPIREKSYKILQRLSPKYAAHL